MDPIDFSSRKSFPGEVGNPLDRILHLLEKVDKIPHFFFLVILAFLALAGAWFDVLKTTIIFCFMALDWVLLFLLPRLGLSFGPSKPPVLILAIFRAVMGFLPSSILFILQAVGTAALVYGFFIEPFHIKVTRQTLKTKKYKGQQPLRLLHLGDLHVERITKRERELLLLVKELKPDLILFSGDILNLSYLADELAKQDARWVFSNISAPLGVYAVSGSPAVDLAESFTGLIADLPLIRLDNQKTLVKNDHGEVELFGITCTHRPHLDGAVLENLIDHNNRFKILLYHTPDLVLHAAKAGVDLQLSGHTHGGQVRLPLIGALLTGSLFGKKYETGRHNIGNTTLYVTRGIGMEGAAAPRVRFLCPPEIILWEIQPDTKS